MKVLGISIAALAAGLLFSGCASTSTSIWEKDKGMFGFVEAAADGAFQHDFLVRVKPWERDLLAREDMSWTPDPMRASRRSHINFSKEASLVGGSAGGGGCGCN